MTCWTWYSGRFEPFVINGSISTRWYSTGMSGSNGCVGSGCSNAIKAGLQGAKTPTLDGIQSAQVKDTFTDIMVPFIFIIWLRQCVSRARKLNVQEKRTRNNWNRNSQEWSRMRLLECSRIHNRRPKWVERKWNVNETQWCGGCGKILSNKTLHVMNATLSQNVQGYKHIMKYPHQTRQNKYC